MPPRPAVCFAILTVALMPLTATSQIQNSGAPAGTGKLPTATIDSKRDRVVVHRADGIGPILKLSDLPSDIDGVPGFANSAFSDAVLSPDETLLVFGVDGHVSWLGIYDLQAKLVSPVLIVGAGSIKKLYKFDHHNRFIPVQVVGASGLSSLKLIDVASKQVYATVFDEKPSEYDPTLLIDDITWASDDRDLTLSVRTKQTLVRHRFSIRSKQITLDKQ